MPTGWEGVLDMLDARRARGRVAPAEVRARMRAAFWPLPLAWLGALYEEGWAIL